MAAHIVCAAALIPMPERHPVTPQTFADLGVPAPLVAVLAADGKTEPFPIQADTLPDTLAGRDVLGRGKTGSGKTIAFSLPLAARLGAGGGSRRGASRPRGLVLAPTRELATQIDATLAPLAAALDLRTTTIFGGVSQNRQVAALKAGVDIVVACPGRLEDLMKQGFVSLADIEITVLDEADHMADLGFLPTVTRILDNTPKTGQRLLFSATLDNGVDKLVKRFLHDEVLHSVDEATSHVEAMTHHIFEVATADEKRDLVHALASGTGRRILFTRTKHQAKRLAKQLTSAGIPAVDLHGNLSQSARDRNLAAFGSGDVRVLVATDVAARGVHVDEVELVVHVDPPAEHKAYLHRSGRTARAGSAGDVATVMLPEQAGDMKSLLKAAAIAAAPQRVTAASPAVTTLVGERAAPVPPPAVSGSTGGGNGNGGRNAGAGNGRRTGSGRSGKSSGRSVAGETGSAPRGGTPQGGGRAKGQSSTATNADGASAPSRRRGKRSGAGRGGETAAHRPAEQTTRGSGREHGQRGGGMRVGDLVDTSTRRGLGTRRARG